MTIPSPSPYGSPEHACCLISGCASAQITQKSTPHPWNRVACASCPAPYSICIKLYTNRRILTTLNFSKLTKYNGICSIVRFDIPYLSEQHRLQGTASLEGNFPPILCTPWLNYNQCRCRCLLLQSLQCCLKLIPLNHKQVPAHIVAAHYT